MTRPIVRPRVFWFAHVALLTLLALASAFAAAASRAATRTAAGAGPALTYSTYFASEFEDQATAIAADARGNVWVVGSTNGRELPVRGGVGHSDGYFSDAF